MTICIWRILRSCLKCQGRKTLRLTVRWPILSMTLPEGPGIGVCVHYLDHIPVTSRGITYILFSTDRFSHRADMSAATAAEFKRHIPLWGYPRSILFGNGFQFCSKISHAVDKLLGIRKIATSPYHPNGNAGVDRVCQKVNVSNGHQPAPE